MPPRKKQNSSSSSTTSSRKSNSSNQPQPSKFGIQHFFERHTQNVLASQKLQNASHPTISVPKPANEVQSCNVNLASLNPKDDSLSNKNRLSNASPENPIVEVGVDAQPLGSLSEVSPEISKSLSLKRLKFSPGMLIKQSQDDGGDEITWRISPVNEKLQTVSKRIPEAVRMLADASRLNSLSIHQCSKNEGTTRDFDKWDSSSSISRASERSLVSSLNKVGLKRVNPDHNVDVNGSLTDITSSGVVSKESPFRTPPSLSYCHAKLANEVACNGTSDHPGLRQHKKALLELLDQVEDVISVEVPVDEKPMTSLCPVKDTNEDEIAAKSNLAVKTSARQLLKKRTGESSNCHFLVLEVSETCEPAHSSNAQCPYKVLRVLNEQDGAERSLYLWDEWFYSLVAPGDCVNVIGEFDDQGKCHVKHDINFLIIHPDILVSGTRVAGSFNCPRRTVLDERLRCSEHSTAALIGTLFHEIFQVALTMEMPTISFLEDFSRSVIQKHMESLYACGVNDNDMHKTLAEGIPKLLGWVNFFKNSQDSEDPIVEFGSDVGTKNITVSEVVDIEEMAWAPKYGLKGMIDASIKVKVGSNKYEANEKVMPLEFKTGKAPNGQSSMEHTAQVILYTLLMSERYKKHIDSGLLYYLQSDHTQGIIVQRSDLIGLIMRRNELANDLLKALTKQVLPPMLQSQSICRSCRHLSVCTIYHKGHGGNTDSSGLGDLFDSNTDHLTAAHSTFLRHWDWLIDLEAKVMQLAKIEIWRSRSLEIDPATGCLFSIIPEGGLPYQKSEKDNRYIYHFVRYDVLSDNDELSDINFLNANSCPKKYLDCNLRIGDHVIIGNESGHLTVATGIVTDLSDNRVSVSFAKRLRIPGSTCPEVSDLLKEVWRIDKDEFMTSFAVMRFNLVQLFLPSAQSTHIRKMIVDLEVPRFDSGCILSQDPAITYIWSEKNLNDDQRQAILKILAAKDYTLILGMPGTGKTSTMVHAVRALLIRGASILLTSYTNSAVDNLLIKLKAQNIDFLRIGRQEAVHEEVRGYCFSASTAAESTQSVGDIKSRLEQVKIVAVTCLGITSPLLASKKFDICIMDEAGQTTLPVSLGPLMFASTFVLVGDHYQLPPLVQSVEARENGMGVSLFRRLSEAHPQAISVLRSQYRMCQSIMALSNALIYGNKLRCGSPNISNAKLKFSSRISGSSWLYEILDPSRPVIFVNTDMLPAFETKDHKTVNNPMEAHIVVQVTEELVNNGIEGEDIGIITPYNSQANIIRHSTNLTSVEIHTIDKYQGRDKDCILVSFVRSNENPRNCTSSLLGDWHRINVALTRAKKKLIMVGSCKTLSKVPLLKLLIEKVDEQSGIFNVSKKDVECRRELKRCSQLR